MNDSSYAWEDFSSDSRVDEENDVGGNKVTAKKKVPSDKQQKSKAQKEHKVKKPPKKKAVDNVKFGVDGGHKFKGKKFKPSPKGAPMNLSRRLSRRITKASPLRSPIVAAKLVFSGSGKKKKAWTK